MGKYVRIEDGRIIDFSGATSVQIHAFRSHYKFVKESDTIEDLCDKFIIVLPYLGRKYVVSVVSKFLTPFEQACFEYEQFIACGDKCYLYGAIWTDKGLIYVAKMNEKGELELI